MLTIRQSPSPNFDARAAGSAVNYLILHYTEIDAAAAEARFLAAGHTSYGGPVSAHYMIDYGGMVTQFVDESMRAWHAGVSDYDGQGDVNSRSIGIEIENDGQEEYRPVQMAVLRDLAMGILSRHPIPPCNVLGHEDVAPDRKIDPGPLLDWYWLSQQGIGIWPEPGQADRDAVREWNFDTDPRAALIAAGYNGAVPLDMLWEAFYNHYMPDPGPEATAWLHRLVTLRRERLAEYGLPAP